MGIARGPLRRRHSGKGRAVPERLPVDPYFVMRAVSVAKGSRSLDPGIQDQAVEFVTASRDRVSSAVA